MYTIAWEVDFEYNLFEPRKEDWTDVATRWPTDAENGSVDHYIIENERGSANENESCNERMNEDDVTENEIRPRSTSSRDASSLLSETPSGNENENDVINNLHDVENISNRCTDITVPGISENENSDANLSPRGRKYNLQPNHTPNFTGEKRYESEV